MYPNLYYALRDIFGVEWTGLRFVNSFGFFVALAFLAAAYTLTRELKRKERSGLLQGEDVKVMVGKPATAGELALNFILGFVLGYKIIGLFIANNTMTADPQQFIFSADGSWGAGIALGLIFAGVKWWERNKQKLPQPEERVIRIWPHDRVGDLVIYAAIFGFIGAKIFHNLENWKDFRQNPVEALLSFSGLTFYGGLICAALAIWRYARKHGIGIWHLNDAIAPALMLAYAVGRMGCMVAGDGDWGILNSAYITTPDSKVRPADTSEIRKTLEANAFFYTRSFDVKSIDEVPHKSVKGPSWLPSWMIAFPFPHNVIGEGVKISGCEGQYCSQLPIPVFPTPFYEIVMCLLLFALLWSVRKKFKIKGTFFAFYLILNGIERFFIELIRVNTKYDIFGIHPTQAELISLALVLTGVGLLIWLPRKFASPVSSQVK